MQTKLKVEEWLKLANCKQKSGKYKTEDHQINETKG